MPEWRSSGVTDRIALWRCSRLYHVTNRATQRRAASRLAKGRRGYPGVCLSVRNSGFRGTLAERSERIRFLIGDRGQKFTERLDGVLRSDGIEVIRTPFRAPQANGVAERFVRTARSECLDRLLILNQQHLQRVVEVFVEPPVPIIGENLPGEISAGAGRVRWMTRLPAATARILSGYVLTTADHGDAPHGVVVRRLVCAGNCWDYLR